MEDNMDSSAVSEEEEEEEEEEEQQGASLGGGAGQSSSKATAVGDVILEGKRTKKTVERLDLQAPKQREKLRVEDGGGDKLGDIPRTNHQITRMKPADLKPLHVVLFDRPGKMVSIKKNLRLFNGFCFDADSEQFTRKRGKLLKSSHITNSKLKLMCSVLDLEKKGTHSDLVDRILHFLVSPRSSGKRLLVKKRRKSKKKLSGDDSSAQKKKKSKPRASSAPRSPKKAKAGSKSKAIVMDSSSDEDEEEEEEERGGAMGEEKPSAREEEHSEEEDEGEEEEEEVEDEEEEVKVKEEKSKTRTKRPGKRPRTPPKKSAPPRKRVKQVPEESQSESDGEEQPKKKRKKSAAKTKKADSSSNSKTTNADLSDEDEPLINMIKKAPSDDQLKETVKSLLKEANLEEITMKQICQRVFDTYPGHELSSRKDFIKQMVRSLIT